MKFKMRRISILVTILITSLVMTLSGLVASPAASAADSHTVTKSFTFARGSHVLTRVQKVALKKLLTTAGKTATFQITAAAGKLPGVRDSEVQFLAKKRGQVLKAYLVKLGVKKSHITINLKMTRLGIVPKTVVSAYVATTPTPTPTPTPTVALTCATGGTCRVGDRGPGSGIVYYVNNAGFSCGSGFTETVSPTGGKCHYLEVAPSAWRPGDGSEEGGIPWAVTDNQNVDVSGIANDSFEYFSALGIGLGYKNSDLIVAQGNDTTTAAGAARAYTNNSKSDWYLPTTAEINLLCQWNHGVTQDVTSQCTGGTFNAGIGASASGLITGNYWSSSEEGSGSVWVQFFFNGTTSSPDKVVGICQVRPVRAF